jgi:hypothetical protein
MEHWHISAGCVAARPSVNHVCLGAFDHLAMIAGEAID